MENSHIVSDKVGPITGRECAVRFEAKPYIEPKSFKHVDLVSYIKYRINFTKVH